MGGGSIVGIGQLNVPALDKAHVSPSWLGCSTILRTS